ncbi:MAG: class I SAM-dependent methyltransferase [Dehalococcoidia bacterium]|nr:class I SAM-dependent methyltransferase [Dehalococcoidia bacterium]
MTGIDFVGYEVLIEFIEERRLYELEGDIIEIGSFMGGGTAKLARYAARYGKKAYAVDVFDITRDTTPGADGTPMCDVYQAFLEGRSQAEVYAETIKGLDNVVTIAGDSRGVRLPEGQAFMFGFIDGNHQPEYVTNDFYLVWRCLVPGGAVAFHDYGCELPEVTAAIDGLVERHRDEIENVEEIREKHIILLTRKRKAARE